MFLDEMILNRTADLADQHGMSEKDNALAKSDITESQMCVKAVIELQSANGDMGREAKILDFSAGKGYIGKSLQEQGFTDVYAQEGSASKKKVLMAKNIYQDIETFIVGKQGLPKSFRRTFDFVTCSWAQRTRLVQ